jgi:hypothetical protein
MSDLKRWAKMKKKHILIAIGSLIAIASGYFVYTVVFPIGLLIFSMSAQMNAGQAVLKGLTPEKLKIWADRSQSFWANTSKADYGMGVYGIGKKPIPVELAALKIIRIDIEEDSIEYVWLGGMDHTYLYIEKERHGNLHFYAQYDDETRKDLGIVVSKTTEPNQALQTTTMAVTPAASHPSRQP